jgi:UDP-4-amino-4,6-dideoxy-N-acetyl-beta-L-altrosamine transaminase
VNREFLPYGRHELDSSDIESVIEVLRGTTLTQGPTVRRFEAGLEAKTGAPFAVAVSSGTAALHAAYAALGLGPGDELITSPITFVATANAARQLGADVAFADVDAQGNLDPNRVRELITPRTRGITAVHFAGLPADLAQLRAIADEHGLFLVEDAAHALGAKYRGTEVGSGTFGDLTTLSFHPVKHITTAEGGAVLGRNSAHQEALLRLREHGLRREPAPESEGLYGYTQASLGYNYRLSDVHAALGVSQLQKLETIVERRRSLVAEYKRLLASLPSEVVRTLAEPEDRQSSHHLMPVLINFAALGMPRGKFMAALRSRGIGSQVHYIPVSEQPFYAGSRGGDDCRGARKFYAEELSLPLFPAMSEDDVQRVVHAMREIIVSCQFRQAI